MLPQKLSADAQNMVSQVAIEEVVGAIVVAVIHEVEEGVSWGIA